MLKDKPEKKTSSHKTKCATTQNENDCKEPAECASLLDPKFWTYLLVLVFRFYLNGWCRLAFCAFVFLWSGSL